METIRYYQERSALTYDTYDVENYLRAIQKYFRTKLKKNLGGKEEKGGKLYHYAITLTGHDNYDKIIKSIVTSKMFKVINWCGATEMSSIFHVHLLLQTQVYIKSKEIYTKNKKKRVDVQTLKTAADVHRWHAYIHKENGEILGKCFLEKKDKKNNENENVIII